MILVAVCVLGLTGCGSIISRTFPGQGHGNQYYPRRKMGFARLSLEIFHRD